MEGSRGSEPSRVGAVLGALWHDLLEAPSISTDDDFFRLGGDSLRAVRMLVAVEERLGVHVGFGEFAEEPTLAALAAAVSRARPGEVEQPGTVTARAACTSAQRRLWLADQLAPDKSVYSMPLGFRLRGRLDADALERSLHDLAGRHEALRTSFEVEEDELRQLVATAVDLPLRRRDLSGAADPEAAARERFDALTGEPFDLGRAPLARAELLRLGEEDHVLLLVLHHIVCDGWSHVVLARELGVLYHAYAAGREPALPALRGRPSERGPREQERLRSPEIEERIVRRAEQLRGAPPVHRLPADRPRPRLPSFAGRTRRTPLDPAVVTALRAFARDEGATPFAVLLAAVAALVHRCSGDETVVLGSTVAARDRPELQDAVGLFAETVALRCDLAGAPTFRGLVARVRRELRNAIANADLPFERIVAELAPDRDAARHPVFQLFVAHVPPAPLDLPGAEPFTACPRTARFDLTVWAEERGDGSLALVWESADDLFDAATVERLERLLLQLLAAGLAAPGTRVAELALTDAADRRRLVRAAGGSAAHPFGCLNDLFAAQADRTPDAVAVRCEGDALTYAELDAEASRLARRLRRVGVGRGTLVALCVDRSLRLPGAVLGILAAGGAYVPLDPGWPPERLARVVADAGLRFAVTEERFLERLPAELEAVCLDRDAASIAAESTERPEPAATPDDVAYVIHTSGSTGVPKGVEVEHRNVARLFGATRSPLGFGPGDVWTLLHSTAFDFSVWELFGALLHGGTLVVVPLETARSPERLARLVADARVAVLSATPSLFAELQDELLLVPAALRLVVLGGEALRPRIVRRWLERTAADGPALVNMYGITEATVHSTLHAVTAGDCDHDRSPIGRPLDDVEVHVLDRRLEPVPERVVGELWIGGAGVARGYLDRPDLTAERFVASPFGPGRLYRSGDLGRRLADGAVEFLGRADEQVQIRGFRVEPGEVEAALAEHPEVVDVAVLTLEPEPGDVRLAAYAAIGRPLDADESAALRRGLRSFLAARLPEFARPAYVEVVGRLPLTANGKLDRAALPPPLAGAARTREPLSSLAQQSVAAVWREVLGVDAVSADDDFFHLGGHSLLAARVVTRVRHAFGADVSIRAVFEHPVLADFAAHVEAAPRSAAAPAQASGADEAPLSFQQQGLLLHAGLDAGSPVYNALLAERVEGELDLEALRAALAAVIRRHEPLRTRLVWEGETPRQTVGDVGELQLDELDLCALAPGVRERELFELVRDRARRPFDLAAEAPLRAAVVRLGGDANVLCLETHHATVDAWAVEILFRELGELYDAARAGRSAALPDLPVTYREAAAAERARLSGDALADELAWWRAELAGAPTELTVPGARPRPAKRSRAGVRFVSHLPRESAEAVRRLCRETGTTPYMLFAAVLGTVLYRRSGRDDLLLGSPVANRSRPELEPLVGFLANTVALRVRLVGNPTFREALARVREATLRTLEHGHVPLELVVGAVRPRREPGLDPLVQVNLRVRTEPLPRLRLAGAVTTPLRVDLGVARFDLALEVELADDAIELELIGAADILDADALTALAADVESVLAALVDDPGLRLLALELPVRAAGTSRPAATIRGRATAR